MDMAGWRVMQGVHHVLWWRVRQVTLDMVEMVFAKADPRVSLLYEEHLCRPELHQFGNTVRTCALSLRHPPA